MKSSFCLMFVCLTLVSAVIFDPNLPVTDVAPLPDPLPLTPYLQVLERLVIGLADEAGIEAIPNVTACLDESSAEFYFQFMSQILDELSQKDWIGLPETVEQFKEGIIPAVEDCLASDIGLKSIWDAYGIAGLSLVNLYVKSAAYAIGGNYGTLMQNLSDIHTVFQRGQYEIAARLIGQLIRTVVNYDPSAPSFLFSNMRSMFLNTQRYREDDNEFNNRYSGYSGNQNQNRTRYQNEDKDQDQDQNSDQNQDDEDNNEEDYELYQNNNYNNYQYNDEEEIQYQYYEDYNNGEDNYGSCYDRGDPAPDLVYDFFVGLAKTAKQPPPKTIKSCLNYISGRIILDFVLNVAGEINDRGFERISPTIQGFERSMSWSSMRCFAKNKDFKNLLAAYGIKEKTPLAFAKRLAVYGQTKDPMKIIRPAHKVLLGADIEDFTGAGQDFGQLLKVVFKPTGTPKKDSKRNVSHFRFLV